MIGKIHKIVIALLLMELLLSACGQRQLAVSTLISTPSIRSTYANASILTPSLTPTTNYLPSSTPTVSPTFTPTELFIPTIPIDEAPSRLLTLVKSNGNCMLPCWIGIIPGTATNSTIFSILSPYTGISTDGFFVRSDPRGLDFLLPKDNNEIQLIISLWPVGVDETRQMVVVHLQQWAKLIDTIYSDVFKQYSLHKIFMQYGKPSSVSMMANLHTFDPYSAITFEIYISYPEKGIYIRYTTLAEEISGDKVRSCPSEAYIIDLWLTKPDVNNENMKLLTSINNEWGFDRKSVEEAMGTTLDDFYDVFSASSNQCITTPRSVWP
jgi:hypothetical protein